jgi:hypothetical protein
MKLATRVALVVGGLALSAGALAAVETTSTTPEETVPDKILVLVLENKSYSQVRKNAPFHRAFGEKYAYGTAFYAITHPSQPNYEVMQAGSTMGVSNSYKKLYGKSLLSKTIEAGRTYKVYADGMGTDNCRQGDYRKYVRRHNPPAMWQDERALCEQFDVGGKKIGADIDAGTLPNVGFYIPDNCHNSHDCSLRTVADPWFQRKVERVMQGPDWRSGRLVIVLTADEDDHNEGNRIFTAVAHPSLLGRGAVSTKLNLYGLHKTLARFGHTTAQRNAKDAVDVATAFGLDVG